MSKSIFIVGTNTDIGKTFVSGGIVYTLNKNDINTCYFKPVQSGVPKDEDDNLSDVEFIKKISGIKQDIRDMNAYSFEEPISPHLAARRQSVLIDKKKILEQYRELEKIHDYIVIEGAGGVIVPITEDYYIYDLIKDMNSKVIVVASSKVGTINQTCLTVDFLRRQGIEISGIVINRYSGEFYEDDNMKMIEHISGVKVKSIVRDIEVHVESKNSNYDDFEILVKQEYDKSLNEDIVLGLF